MKKIPEGVRCLKSFNARSGFSDSAWLLYRDELAAFKDDYASGKIPEATEADLMRALSNSIV